MKDWLEEAVRREGSAMFAAHVDSEVLVTFVEAPGEIEDAVVSEIQAHLRLCAACEDDAMRLRQVLTADSPQTAAVTKPSLRERVAEWFSWNALVPAAAVAVIALVLLGLPERSSIQSSSPSVRAVGDAVVLKSDVERGGTTVATVDPEHGLSLLFNLPSTADGPVKNCDIVVLDARGAEVARIESALALDEFGTFLLNLDPDALASGAYTLVARDAVGEQRFPFELR